MKHISRQDIIIFAAFLLATAISYIFLDIPVACWSRSLDRFVLDIAEIVTAFGRSTAYLIASFLLYLFFRFYREREIYANRFMFIFASVAISGIIGDIIKWIAGRYRPIMLFNDGLYGFSFFQAGYEVNSFVSGHAVTAFSLALALSILFPKYRIPFFLAAIAIAASRILLSVHFLSDAVFGAYIGIATVQVLKFFFDRKGWALR